MSIPVPKLTRGKGVEGELSGERRSPKDSTTSAWKLSYLLAVSPQAA